MDKIMKIETLACPQCGQTDTNEIEYIETAPIIRKVDGVDENGTLMIHSEYRVNDESPEPGKLHCYSCHAEWSLPTDKFNAIEWV